jgi:putative oxygen-independent coproporphyrinogen III oxidase
MSSVGASIEPAFGVYIHWPFCAQKCPYCDFNSHVRHQGWDEDRFLAAYLRELDAVSEMISSRTVTSIFFGGGTPSLMKPETTAAILDHIAKLWCVDPKAEITLEANPGSVEATRFKGYRAAGINRVSMGFQSLRDDDLKRLGRIHTVDESKVALKIARETFERFSFDLIYARPDQQPDAWRSELAEALDLAGDHISLYQLTIEPDTPYAALHAAGKLIVPDQDAALALYEITQEMTAARGLLPYEISNHARPGQESQHNLLYWRYGEYAGIGPGAHGRLLPSPRPSWGEGAVRRLATVAEKNPEAWAALVEANGHGFTEMTEVSRAEQADEMLLMGLRLREGIDLDRLAALGGVRPSTEALTHLQGLGMIEIAKGRSFAPDVYVPGVASNWRANELEAIAMCAGPGLAPEAIGHTSPEAIGHNAPPSLIRATPKGRFVLNAVVAELSKSFAAADDIDNTDAAQ